MAPTILIVADGLVGDGLAPGLGAAASRLAAAFLADIVAVASSVSGARVMVRHTPRFPRAAVAALAPGVEAAPCVAADGPALAAALQEALATGDPAVLIGADSPHLPPWRLRDALTHLAFGADLVLGPTDEGDWYLLGLAAPEPGLLARTPARGASPGGIAHAARHPITLPLWHAVRTPAALAGLAESLRTMPPGVAAQTRAALAAGDVVARAVGG